MPYAWSRESAVTCSKTCKKLLPRGYHFANCKIGLWLRQSNADVKFVEPIKLKI
jgi:hypothetical protein